MEIHTQLSGTGPGYRHNLEVLNKSAIVLLVATWESYVEELASNSFDFLINNCGGHSKIPNKVLTQASKRLKESKNELDVWQLAESGWVSVLSAHKQDAINKYVKTLNTPRASNVDNMFESLLGINAISQHWFWKGMSNKRAISKLENLIQLRGEIAHTVQASSSVPKVKVTEYKTFLVRLATISHNRCTKHLHTICGKQPWTTYRYEKTV